MTKLNTAQIHSSWLPLVNSAMTAVDPSYLKMLEHEMSWLPGADKIFNAFSIPLASVSYILMGESPYPRALSANGFAFWDASVHELWSQTGLSRSVNCATSLRNLIKMLLIARKNLSPTNTSQEAIAEINKNELVITIDELFANFQAAGIMLLNASLTLTEKGLHQDARAWLPFMEKLLKQLADSKPQIELILLGRIAQSVQTLPEAKHFKQFQAEHPYNVSFVTNPNVLKFFKHFDLLKKPQEVS